MHAAGGDVERDGGEGVNEAPSIGWTMITSPPKSVFHRQKGPTGLLDALLGFCQVLPIIIVAETTRNAKPKEI